MQAEGRARAKPPDGREQATFRGPRWWGCGPNPTVRLGSVFCAERWGAASGTAPAGFPASRAGEPPGCLAPWLSVRGTEAWPDPPLGGGDVDLEAALSLRSAF